MIKSAGEGVGNKDSHSWCSIVRLGSMPYIIVTPSTISMSLISGDKLSATGHGKRACRSGVGVIMRVHMGVSEVRGLD